MAFAEAAVVNALIDRTQGRRGLMDFGRLIRVSKCRGDRGGIAYIIAVSDPAKAIALIRTEVADPGDDVQDLGRVSDALIATLQLGPGQYKRA